MKIVINAAHTKFGKGTGAVGYIVESKETRKIAFELMKLLTETNHEVIPCIFDKSTNNLKEAVDLANNEQADLFLSIHLNAGGGTGCEAFTYKGAKHQEATKMLKNLENLGFKNRGVKDGTQFYVVKNTKMKAILIEIFFLDTKKDVELYNKVGVERIAQAIFEAIK